jgi:hypothetical protein
MVSVKVAAEGRDLADGDNQATAGIPVKVGLPAPPESPAFRLTVAKSQKLRHGVALRVSAAKAGRARVVVAFKVRGRTVTLGKVVKLEADVDRAVTVRATGAKLRSLQRALRKRPLTARIIVRTISGTTPVAATTRVVR